MNWADYKKKIIALDSSEMKRIETAAKHIKQRLELALIKKGFDFKYNNFE